MLTDLQQESKNRDIIFMNLRLLITSEEVGKGELYGKVHKVLKLYRLL